MENSCRCDIAKSIQSNFIDHNRRQRGLRCSLGTTAIVMNKRLSEPTSWLINSGIVFQLIAINSDSKTVIKFLHCNRTTFQGGNNTLGNLKKKRPNACETTVISGHTRRDIPENCNDNVASSKGYNTNCGKLCTRCRQSSTCDNEVKSSWQRWNHMMIWSLLLLIRTFTSIKTGIISKHCLMRIQSSSSGCRVKDWEKSIEYYLCHFPAT